MKSDIRQTKIIHFPTEDINKVTAYSPEETKLRTSISVDVFSVYNNTILPIIVVGHVQIFKDDLVLFSCIMHTKVLLTFELHESPVTQLINMLETVREQEKNQWQTKVYNTPFQFLDFNKIPANNEVNFNKAYQLIESARKHHLLA